MMLYGCRDAQVNGQNGIVRIARQQMQYWPSDTMYAGVQRNTAGSIIVCLSQPPAPELFQNYHAKLRERNMIDQGKIPVYARVVANIAKTLRPAEFPQFHLREITRTKKGEGMASLGDLCDAANIAGDLDCIGFSSHLQWPGVPAVLELWAKDAHKNDELELLIETPHANGPRALWTYSREIEITD